MERLCGLLQGCAGRDGLLAAIRSLDSEQSAALVPPLLAVVQELVDRGAGGQPAAQQRDQPGGTAAAESSLDGALSLVKGMSLLTPRSKFDVAFFKDHLTCISTRGSLQIPFKDIVQVLVLEHLPPALKGPAANKSRMLVVLSVDKSRPVKWLKGEVQTVAIQTTVSQTITVANPKKEGDELTEAEPTVLCMLLGLMGVVPEAFAYTDEDIFLSHEKCSGVPIKIKIDEAHLFPMKDSLCIIHKAGRCIQHSDIRSIEFARTNGSTFDIYIHLSGGERLELGMIGRPYLNAIERYCEHRQLQVGPPPAEDEESASDNESSEGNAEAEDEESDSEDDQDFDPEASDNSSGGGGGNGSDGESSDSDSSYGGDDGNCELFSDDEISASRINTQMQQDRDSQEEARRAKKRKAADEYKYQSE